MLGDREFEAKLGIFQLICIKTYNDVVLYFALTPRAHVPVRRAGHTVSPTCYLVGISRSTINAWELALSSLSIGRILDD